MKHIIKKLALLFVPVYLWFAFFVAFEPNNYFGSNLFSQGQGRDLRGARAG